LSKASRLLAVADTQDEAGIQDRPCSERRPTPRQALLGSGPWAAPQALPAAHPQPSKSSRGVPTTRLFAAGTPTALYIRNGRNTFGQCEALVIQYLHFSSMI